MTLLMQIQSFIQAYVMAVSSILEAEVTVIDDRLIRVGGTGYYEGELGRTIAHDSFFREVLLSGAPGIIPDVRTAFACNACARKDRCKELANLAYPIFMGDAAVGVIGIIAFQEQEREKLLRDRDKLGEFLKYMSMLIESKLVTEQHNNKLEHQINEVVSWKNSQASPENFIGQSQAIRQMLALADKVSGSDSTVLISGESGTGKELLAKRIHAQSPRGGKLMISLNCGAIPETLVESELFGYEGGAFTGAKREGHIGKFELAQGSTIFLDEIGELPHPAQTKLLRVLQERCVERIGGRKNIPVDVRVICATNRNLSRMVEEGKFREDLFYRLHVIPVRVPPLRERREDIPLFIRYFIGYYDRTLRSHIKGMTPEAVKLLERYDWPGNVRELKNIIEYLVNIVEGDTIREVDLPNQFRLKAGAKAPERLCDIMADYERMVLERLVESAPTAGEKQELAENLGISRATLYRKLSGYGLL